jgi:hypothetical protein
MTRGRWGGRLTSRPLPENDETLDALSAADREELALHWLARAQSERRVGEAFAFIRDQLQQTGADASLVALADRAVDDEQRHFELSRQVASRFAGRSLPAPEPLPLAIPQHPGASAELLPALWVLGQCAFNETFASGVLEASLAAAEGPLAKAALRELLSDEVDHARLGWTYLAALEPGRRAEVGRWLLRLGRANLRMWRTAPREYPSRPELVTQGALSLELLEPALLGALGELIIPGFEHLGLPTDELKTWLADGAPT